ncbi:MAG TPA: hypothetical protein VGX70_11245 [Gemmataceae bacterium]|nr:hypothetical protein [Gemmataceae bacterium]
MPGVRLESLTYGVGGSGGRQRESAKLQHAMWRTRFGSQVILEGQLADKKRASPPLLNA